MTGQTFEVGDGSDKNEALDYINCSTPYCMSDAAKNLDYRQSERSALSTGSLRAKTYVFILPGYIVSTCIHQQRLHRREGGSENTFNLPCPSESFENPILLN